MNFARENKGRPRARACAATSHSSPSGKYTIQNSAETPFAKERVHARVCLDGGVVPHRGRARNGYDSSDITRGEREKHGRTDRRTDRTDGRKRARQRERGTPCVRRKGEGQRQRPDNTAACVLSCVRASEYSDAALLSAKPTDTRRAFGRTCQSRTSGGGRARVTAYVYLLRKKVRTREYTDE